MYGFGCVNHTKFGVKVYCCISVLGPELYLEIGKLMDVRSGKLIKKLICKKFVVSRAF